MSARDIYDGSDGDATKRYYQRLCEAGPIGVVAMNLFRAQKCSARAKKYRGGIKGVGSFRSLAYERKTYSMEELCGALQLHGSKLGINFGWKLDPATPLNGGASWVLYVDLPHLGQISFHSPTRMPGPDYPGEWDRERRSEERILAFCEHVAERRAVCMDSFGQYAIPF
jgi:hypothetical protein